MKKIVILSLISIIIALPAFSQSMGMAESNNYRVFSELGEENAEYVAKAMDQYFKLYNQFFHFNENDLESKLQIRLFNSKNGFDNYLTSIISQTSSSYVYLQYKNTKKSELVIYVMDDLDKMKRTLVHHGFVQFLKSFIKQPPLWLQKGFAVYFEKSIYNDKDNTVTYQDNLNWAVTLKKYIAADQKDPLNQKLFSIPDLLTLDSVTANKSINVFYAESWGLVSFLINSEYQEYNRVLWDSLSSLQPSAEKKDNEASVIKSAFKWTDNNIFLSDFYFYAESLKTFNELVQDGIKSYSAGSPGEAERIFIKAMIIDEGNYIPYYYMGLINYDRKDFTMAEYYYQTTIEKGGNQDLLNYALGVNSYAENNLEDAVFYLNKITTGDYYTKATELMEVISDDTTRDSENTGDSKGALPKTSK